MDIPQSDAFVFFGATGDLAFKNIFPALQAMIKHGHLVLLCYKQKQNEIELFCGKENLRARSTRETFCRIHGRPGQSRRTR